MALSPDVRFHIHPLLLIGMIQTFIIIIETGKKNMIAIITERVITIDSTESNAGRGRGLFHQDPPLAWMLWVFLKDKQPRCACWRSGTGSRGAHVGSSPQALSCLNCFGSQAFSWAAAYAAWVPKAKIKSHPPPPLWKFNNKMELSPLPINCLF